MTRDNDLMMILMSGALCATLAGPALAQVAPSYFGMQGYVSMPTNTNNDNKYEASSEMSPGFAAFVGWTLKDWLAIEARGTWQHQHAHGYNPDGPDFRESIEGSFDAVSVMACPVLRLPDLPVATPYARACIGPGYRWTDLTPSSVTGRVPNENGLALAYEAAGGVEIELEGIRALFGSEAGKRAAIDNLSLRLEGGYQAVSPIQGWFGGVAIVYALGE